MSAWWLYSAIALLAVMIGGLLLHRQRTLAQLRGVLDRLQRGDYTARFLRPARGAVGHIATQLNALAEQLERHAEPAAQEREQLRTVFECMADGVLVTDAAARIVLINPALARAITREDHVGAYAGRSVLECLRNPPIHDTIQSTLAGTPSAEVEIVHRTVEGERRWTMHTVPIRDRGIRGTVSVFHDVSHLRRLEHVRRDFLANVAHEFKTPLTSIRGYAETLRDGAIQDAARAGDFLDRIVRNAAHLQQLVETLLQLGAMEVGRYPLQPITLSVAAALIPVTESLQPRLHEKSLLLQHRVAPEIQVRADPEALRQMLTNLLDNAVKFTPAHGTIIVNAVVEPPWIRITVTDTGIGIAAADLPRIFERFYRVDPGRARDGGAGLGLAIVKHLAHLHGGTIEATSTPGAGTCFLLSLPLS